MTKKFKIKNLKFCILNALHGPLRVYSFAFFVLSFTFTGYAEEITILYTGQTHAMLYPCNCPLERDGGVARRATLIKQLRKSNPHTLVLDSGSFFAGGLMDENTQNIQLDRERTLVNLKAIELMGYDALNIGDDEFNFGREFLEENITQTKIPFVSCNIKSDKLSPYIIKEIAGTKIGIIGVASLSAIQKAGGLNFIEPKLAVEQRVEELKKNNVNIVVLLSSLGESEDLRLIEEIKGIDIIISGYGRSKEESSTKVNSTLILRPLFEGRKLGKLSLILKDNKIIDYKAEEIRLSDKLIDDPDILSILPACFSDIGCKKEGFAGICQNPGSLNSRCQFNRAPKTPLWIIIPKKCIICDTEGIVNYLKTQLPGLDISYLSYPSKKADKLIRYLDIKNLPAYLLAKTTEAQKGFDNLRLNLEKKGDFYVLKSSFTGVSYFLNRKEIKGKLDVFVSLYDNNASKLLDIIKDFAPSIHFLTIEQKDNKFDAKKGNLEVEEYLRALCVKKYYPLNFWDYISCRANAIDSSWWEDCLGNLDTDKIKGCARSEEGRALLKENIGLNKELQVMFGPTFLLDNLEIFSLKGLPSKEDFKKIIQR